MLLAPPDHSTRLPVPREFVHRSADDDVLITHFQTGADGTHRMAARWPRAHALFGPVAGGDNPMLMAETIRQAGAAVAHMAYGAPTDLHFLLWDLRYEVPGDVLAAGVPLSPATAVVRCDDVRRRGGRLASFHLEVDLWRGGLRVGRGGASASCVTRAAYRRLRPARPTAPTAVAAPTEVAVPTAGMAPTVVAAPAVVDGPEPVTPALAGRARARDVLLAATGTPGVWRLRAERGHPVVFDSQSDHLPGRAIVEAMRQAAQLATGYPHMVVPSLDAGFRRYVELDRPCHVTTSLGRPLPGGGLPVRVTLVQDDEVAAEGVLTARPVAGGAS
ncbi:ScbA/BarX family gamma-butyrolactone biosynthesis protein [Streptomyces sp. NPDC020996]|uniref:ScbA/BarX family gamma-butyrolactone biosynthesis protein n=1 Tax=Streptomyces sp. NPDC020996 TaxID=3154791 RepID=UPI0033CC6E2B